MDKKIDAVGLEGILFQTATETPGVYLKDGYGMVANTSAIAHEDWQKYMKPYRTADFQILLVKDGIGQLQYNMEENVIQHGDVIVLKPGVLVMQEKFSESFNLGIISYGGNLQEWIMEEPYATIHPDSLQMDNINGYFKMAERMLQYKPDNKQIIEPLIVSLLYYCGSLCSEDDSKVVRARINGEDREHELYSSFMKLLNEYGKTEHKIPFYADKLNVTPNYFNYVVKKVSGQTIGHWINLLLVSEAKAALAYTSMTVNEISDALSFSSSAFFSKFFKRHVGMRPLEYRKS